MIFTKNGVVLKFKNFEYRWDFGFKIEQVLNILCYLYHLYIYLGLYLVFQTIMSKVAYCQVCQLTVG